MLDKLKALWARLKVRWEVLSVALLAASPQILDYLGIIDLRPLLERLGVDDMWISLIVGGLPFVLMFLRNVVHLEPEEAE